MSLFGDDDEEFHTPGRPGSGLFADATPTRSSARRQHSSGTANSNSLFADDPTPGSGGGGGGGGGDPFGPPPGGSDDSPWSLPTPRSKGAGGGRSALVRNLLAGEEVPEAYVDVFDALVGREGGGAEVSARAARELVATAKGLGEADKGRVLEVVVGAGGSGERAQLGRGEVNVLLALVGLAQEGEDVTLDGVDERRRNLPVPHFHEDFTANPAAGASTSSITTTATQASKSVPPPSPTPASKQQAAQETPSTRRTGRTPSFGLNDPDPWGSPALHKNHNHAQQQPAASDSAGTAPNMPRKNSIPSHILGNGTGMGARTTSDFTTASASDASGGGGAVPPASAGGWGGYNGASNEGFGGDFGGLTPDGSAAGGSNAGGSGGGGGGPAGGLGRSLGGGRTAPGGGPEEVVTVTAMQEKEGMFLFQHHNYEVTSARRASKVIRRYSDFVWLLDCLHKRYPFRQLPLLPPKRVAINGNYIAADASFVEKRRRGLARFANALVRHPVLCQEQLVVMFLTVPTELAVWRKQATISVQEEFTGKLLPAGLEDSLPADLPDLFDRVRAGVRRSAEIYINLCNLTERLAKRNEGVAADHARYAQALHALRDCSPDTYAADVNDVPLLNEGLGAAAKHLAQAGQLLEDEARAWEGGVLEDLKRQRDCLVGVRDLFDRRDKLARDNIPQLEKRISNNEGKLAGIRAKPESQQRPGEAEKVEDAIVKDKQSIVAQHARGVLIRECIRDELLHFQHSLFHVSRTHQDWSQERVKYAELAADNWRALGEEVEGMPLGD